MNNKGFMRVVEATIAVVIILGVLILISSRGIGEERRDLSAIIPPLLDEVAKDSSIRDSVMTKSRDDAALDVEFFLTDYFNNYALTYVVEVCEVDEVCYLDPYPAEDPDEVFAGERVISSALGSGFTPKKVKLFLWRG